MSIIYAKLLSKSNCHGDPLKRNFLLFCFALAMIWSLGLRAQPSVPPKAKAVLIMSGYGAAGGALLGLASMAFDGKARNIPRGASLGLYAGLLFSAYVIYSHYNPYVPYEYPDDGYSPYDSAPGPGSPGPRDRGRERGGDQGGDDFFSGSMRYDLLHERYSALEKIQELSGRNEQSFAVNILTFEF